MADNLTTTTTVATIPNATRVATRDVTYSGDASSHIAPVGLVTFGGSDDAKTATDVTTSNPLPVSDAGGTLSIDDGAGSITVDGTVAVSGTVTVGSHAVTNAGTFATQIDGAALTALQLIDNIVLAEDAVAGSGDPGVALLAVRRDAASAGAADGDYANLSVDSNGALRVSGSSGTTQYAEDSVAASGDSLVVVGAVRRDSASSGVGADGDYAALSVDANGALRVVNGGASSVFLDDAAFTLTSSAVSVIGAIRDDSLSALAAAEGDAVALRVSSTGALHVTGGGGGTQFAEDAAHASGDVGTLSLAVRRDSAAVSGGTDGDYSTFNVDSSGRLWVNASGAAVPVTDNSSSLTVDNGGTFAVQVTSVAAGTNNIGDVDVASIAAGDNNIGNVDIVTMPNVTLAAGTNTNEVVGDAAHDAAVAGNPVRVGARAESALSGITLVADGDTTDLYAGLDGVLIVRNHSNLEDVVQERTTNTDGASTAFASGLAAPGANIRLCITNVDICNSSATFCTVDLRDGSAGSVLWTLPVPATGGVVKTFDPPLKLTANTALAFDASAATTTLTISANGFKSKL